MASLALTVTPGHVAHYADLEILATLTSFNSDLSAVQSISSVWRSNKRLK